MKEISILGSTGSIGTQALDVIRQNTDKFKVKSIACGKNIRLFKEQIAEFKPDIVSVELRDDAERIKTDFPFLEVVWGNDGISHLIDSGADLFLNALVGMRGMIPTHRAALAGADVALANKEALVTGGDIIMSAFKYGGGRIIPVDSEHSAIFQCMEGNKNRKLRSLILTASGGPFRNYSSSDLKSVTCADALNHPSWSMGKKISIDSATLMNKGLEVIEARWLFDVPADKIFVLIHKEAVIHSMVEYSDGAIIAQLGPADMRIPISFAFEYPGRLPNDLGLDLYNDMTSMTFEKPDMETFPALGLAYEALKSGGSAAIALNGANEYTVEKFLEGELEFWMIAEILREFMSQYNVIKNYDFQDIMTIDMEARLEVEELCKKFAL